MAFPVWLASRCHEPDWLKTEDQSQAGQDEVIHQKDGHTPILF